MSPDTINEIIGHFAGYFRIADDVARDRLEYLEGTYRQQFDDYTVPLPQTPFRVELEPFQTHPFPPPSITTWDASHAPSYPHFRRFEAEPSPDPPDVRPADAPRVIVPGAGGSGGGSSTAERNIIVNYDDDGSQQQVQIHQVNHMEDNDLLLVNPDTGATELNDADTEGALREMAEAADATPDDVALPRGGMADVAEFVEARDEETSENGGGGGDHSVGPGIYVNGELQSEDFAVALPDLSPPADTDEPADTGGQIATLGTNTAVNAGLLVDLHEASPTMIVLGDFFTTEAIVQTYSYTDNDEISVGGSALNDIVADDNSAENIAHFDHQPSVFPDLTGHFSGWTWDVHVIEGDFYDINLLVQDIYISDNDVTVQETQQSLHEVHTGENQQFNLAQVLGGDFDYDLIIIGGDYHGGNYIFQHLFLVDDDIVMMSGTDGEPTQAVGTGDNTLLNYATIQTYGNDAFIPLTEEAESLVTALQDRETTLNPQEYGFVAPAVGDGPLNVLYMTGDYYDINAIWQYITIADADTALQLLDGEQALIGAEKSELAQSIQTGGNKLLNDATIVDVGPGTTQVGGEAYTDTILVQAELVAESDDTILHDDTDALVNELIAFIGAEDNADTEYAPTIAPAQNEDPIGGVLA